MCLKIILKASKANYVYALIFHKRVEFLDKRVDFFNKNIEFFNKCVEILNIF